MNVLRKLIHWTKYNALSDYPALKAFEPSAAMKRLREYEREEQRTCKSWLRFFPEILLVFWIILGLTKMLLVHYFEIFPSMGLFSGCSDVIAFLGMQLSILIAAYVRRQRLNPFIDAKIAEERNSGRWQSCIKCGYDLSASKDQCPECGASVYVLPPTKNL